MPPDPIGGVAGPADGDALLPISVVAERTGLSPDTLRVWERRYGLGATRQSAGGHRRYTRHDLSRLQAAQRLVGNGVPAGEAVRTVLRSGSHDLPLPADASAATHRLAAAALDLDGPTARSLTADQLARHGVLPTWESLVRPVLGALGERWAQLPHGIAAEHLVSSVTDAALRNTPPAWRTRPEPAVLLACVPGEEHALPLVALSAALAERGTAATRTLDRSDAAAQLDAAVSRHAPRITVLHAHLPRRAATAIPRDWAHRDSMLVLSGPGWDPAELPAGSLHTNQLRHALQVVTDLL